MPVLPVVVLLAELTAPAAAPASGRSPALVAAAAASPRPADCADGLRAAGSTHGVWVTAARPELPAYCLELARGFGALERTPRIALVRARRALELLPDPASARVLEARALWALGEPEAAWQAFERAAARGGRSVHDPAALHDLARTAAHLGRVPAAVEAYRRLVARIDLVPDPFLRQHVLVEAAVWTMQLGPAALDESVGYLNEAAEQGVAPGLASFVRGALALALDRQGRVEQARGIADELRNVTALERTLDARSEPGSEAGSARQPNIPTPELHAILAVAYEQLQPELAREHWREFLELQQGTAGAWTEHAERKLAPTSRSRAQP